MKEIKSRICCWLLCCLAAGCADRDASPADDAPRNPAACGVSLSLAFSVDGSGPDASGTGEAPGFDSENAIRNLYVFTEVSGRRPAYPFRHVLLDEDGTTGRKTAVLELPVDVREVGEMFLYLGANLDDRQAEAFCDGNKAYTLDGTETPYNYNVVESFAPGVATDGGASSLRTDIAMFCTQGQKARPVVGEDGERVVVEAEFELRRLVAKVLVTCREDDGHSGYAPLKEGGSLATNGGWIRLEDVYFLVNSLNKSSFIMEKEDEDPNNDLTFYLDEKGGYDGSKTSKDFVYAAPGLQYEVIGFFKRAPKYEENRLPDENRCGGYRPEEALYCPENLFGAVADEGKKKVLEEYEYVWPMITHVSVAAKYTPGRLWIEKELVAHVLRRIDAGEVADERGLKAALEKWSEQAEAAGDPVMEVECPDEYVSQTLLTESLKREKYYSEGTYDPDGGGFPRHTYFYYDNRKDDTREDRYYTYGAVIRMLGDSFDAEEPEKLGNYLPYTQGWGYYYTYIDGAGGDPAGGATPYSRGVVRRNTYYILIVNSFSHPGSSIHDGGYIDVHTLVEEWKEGGSGEIELQ